MAVLRSRPRPGTAHEVPESPWSSREVSAGGLTDKGLQLLDALDEAEGLLAGEKADAQEPSPGLDKDGAELAAIVTALENARPVHVPAFLDSETFGDRLAVAAPSVLGRARATGGKADALVKGPVAGGDTQVPDAREEAGGGAENIRVGESKPGRDDGVIQKGREAAWATRFRRGRHGQDRRFSRTAWRH